MRPLCAARQILLCLEMTNISGTACRMPEQAPNDATPLRAAQCSIPLHTAKFRAPKQQEATRRFGRRPCTIPVQARPSCLQFVGNMRVPHSFRLDIILTLFVPSDRVDRIDAPIYGER